MRKINLNMRKLIGAVIVVVVYCASVQIVAAGTKTWTGSDGNGYWRTNGNWQGMIGAGPNDDLVFVDDYCVWNGVLGCYIVQDRFVVNDFPVNTSFDSIKFSGRGFRVSGNQIFLRNGLTVFGEETAFDSNIVIGARQTWNITGEMTMNGVVHLNGFTLSVAGNGGQLVMPNLINGTGQIIKTGSSKLTINGDGDGFGSTQLNSGVLELNGSLGGLTMSGGTLQGTGILRVPTGSIFTDGGTISPGGGMGSRGTLTVVGGGELGRNGKTTLQIDLQSTATSGLSDRFNFHNNFVQLGDVDIEVSFTSPPTPGHSFTIIQQFGTGDIVGQFNQGTAFIKDNQLFFVSYLPDRVVLTAQGAVGP